MITRDSTGRGIVLFGIQAINNKAAADPGEDFTTTVPVKRLQSVGNQLLLPTVGVSWCVLVTSSCCPLWVLAGVCW